MNASPPATGRPSRPGDAADPARTVEVAGVQATLQRLGAMLAPVVFRAPGLPDFAPLQVAPWADEPGAAALPGILRRLRGDWPCVPFGTTERPAGLGPDWAPREPGDDHGHGYGANHEWHWAASPSAPAPALTLVVDYPAASPVQRLHREVRLGADGTVHLRLAIEVRTPCTLPVALHPTFRLDAGAVRLHAAHAGRVHAYPVPAEPGVSRLVPGAAFATLAEAPLAGGGSVDLRQLPPAFDTEELLQIEDVSAPLRLDYLDLGWCVELDWDRSALPDAMVWLSHRGRRHAPWNGRHRALGLEPVNGCFDLGRVAAPPPGHPLARRTGLALQPGVPTVIDSTLRARPLPAAGAPVPKGRAP